MGGTSEYGWSRWRMDTDIMGDADEIYLMETRLLDWKHHNSNYLIFNLKIHRSKEIQVILYFN